MKGTSRWTWLPLAVFLAAPVLVADDKKPEDAKKPGADKKADDKKPGAPKPGADKKDDKKPRAEKKPGDKKLPPPKDDKRAAEKKALTGSVITGELVHVETGKNTIRVKVSFQYLEPNPSAMQGLMQARLEMARARDLNARRAAMQNMAQQQRNLYTPRAASRDVEIEPGDDCVVRLPLPRAAFDKEGNPKKTSPKELAALRGKDGLFNGEFSDLTVGQLVQITIIKPKGAPAAKPKKEDINFDDLKLRASRIVVRRQPLPQP